MAQITPTKLKKIIEHALKDNSGNTADYIPELANFPKDFISLSIQPIGQKPVVVNTLTPSPQMTLQSTSKLIPLIGLLEEFGPDKVYSWVRVEPSGDDFASISRVDQHGPQPCNPMLNAGAITLCSKIPGEGEHRLAWLQNWVQKLFGHRLSVNNLVLTSERRTGDRNRALAYLLSSKGNIENHVKETLELYFTLCSFEAQPEQLIQLPYLLANNGEDIEGNQIISPTTVQQTLAIMATCGLYNETGTHLVRCGLPAKSGVSGIILAASPGKGGIVVASPRVNDKGNSVRGGHVLEQVAQQFGWHFASP